MIHAITSTRYATYMLAKPTSTEDIAKAFGAGGPLQFARDHALAILLPNACGAVAGSDEKSLKLIDVQAALVAGMLLEPDVAKAGMHWAIGTARVAQCNKDLEDAGTDWTPVKGEANTAIPKASARLTAGMRALPEAKRMLKRAECIWDSDHPQDAKAGTWYDHLTPAMLMAGDGGLEMVAQAMLMLPDAMSKGADGRGGARFKASIEQMAASEGRGIAKLPGMAQAVAVAAWIKRTRPPADMASYIDNPNAEIERRAADTPAARSTARYEPLFAAN